MKLAIVNCAKRKQEYPCGPREMYWKSQLFRSQITFVESRYDNWILLSSEHGLVTQDTILEPYDAYLGSSGVVVTASTRRFTIVEKRVWGIKVAQDLIQYQKEYDTIDAYLSFAYVEHLPEISGIRFMKVNSGGAGLFRACHKWKEMAASNLSVEEHLAQGDLLSSFIKESKVASVWEEEMRAKRWWYHPEFGSHYSDSVYEMTKYAKQFDPLIDGATFGMVIKGKARQHKGWTLALNSIVKEENK